MPDRKDRIQQQLAEKAAKREFDRQKFETRRRFLIIGGILGGSLALGGIGFLGKLLFSPRSKLDEYLNTYREDAQKVDSLLQRTDEAIEMLRQRLTPKLEALPEADRIALLSPIEIYDNNRSNSNRNKAQFLKADLETREQKALEEPTQYNQGNPSYFFVNTLSNIPNVAAAFSPPERTIEVSEKFSKSNLIDVIMLYHELVHSVQDSEDRKKLPTAEHLRRYLDFYTLGPGQTPRILGFHEQEAYLKEILILDLLTNGQFKKDILEGKKDPDYYTKQFGLRIDQHNVVQNIVEIAFQVFSSDSTVTNIAPSFADYINKLYRSQGYQIYEMQNSRVQLVK